MIQYLYHTHAHTCVVIYLMWLLIWIICVFSVYFVCMHSLPLFLFLLLSHSLSQHLASMQTPTSPWPTYTHIKYTNKRVPTAFPARRVRAVSRAHVAMLARRGSGDGKETAETKANRVCLVWMHPVRWAWTGCRCRAAVGGRQRLAW